MSLYLSKQLLLYFINIYPLANITFAYQKKMLYFCFSAKFFLNLKK